MTETSPAATDRLAEIKARRAAITPAPWEYDAEGDMAPGEVTNAESGLGMIADVYKGHAEGQFIAHAPGDIDWLVAALERRSGLLGELLGEYKRDAAALHDRREPERYRRAAQELVAKVEAELG